VALRFALSKWSGSTVVGFSNVAELEETVSVWRDLGRTSEADRETFEGVRARLGEFVDYTWDSPPKDYRPLPKSHHRYIH